MDLDPPNSAALDLAPAGSVPHVRVLGQLQLTLGSSELTPTAPRERIILAVLALGGHRAVALHEILEALWEQGMPGSARNSVQVAISRLRSRLGGSHRIALTSDAYVLRDVTIDAASFRQLVRAARDERGDGEIERARATLQRASALWRGRRALPDMQHVPGIRADTHALECSRLDAVEELGYLLLEQGNAEQAVALLHEEALHAPLRESLQHRFAGALYHANRTAEAWLWLEEFHLTLQRHQLIPSTNSVELAYAFRSHDRARIRDLLHPN